jgi:hypothetical protein
MNLSQSTEEPVGVNLHGKQRLILLAAVAIVLVGGLAMWSSSRASEKRAAATAAADSANISNGTSATPDEVQRLKSWGLNATDVPSQAHLVTGTEVRNYALARGNRQTDLALTQEGRVDGYVQQWKQDTAQIEIDVQYDLFAKPDQALAIFSNQSKPSEGDEIQSLPDPKLGSAGRFYGFLRTPTSGPKVQGWVAQWVRDRTVFQVAVVAPPGELQSEQVLNAAKIVDDRAAKSPIK